MVRVSIRSAIATTGSEDADAKCQVRTLYYFAQ